MIDAHIKWIELDVYFTKDFVPVVYHGNDDGQFTEEVPEKNILKSMKVCDVMYDDICSVDIGGGEKIPSLDETLKLCQDKIGINIEIKETDPKIVDSVLELLYKYHMRQSVFISGFVHPILQGFEEKTGNEMPTSYLYNNWPTELLPAKEIYTN